MQAKLAQEDAYGELLPGAGVLSYEVLSDDEDGERPKRGRKGAAEDEQDAKPAGKTQKQTDAKLSSQLGKIEEMLTEKHGERHSTAFAKRKPPADEGEASEKPRQVDPDDAVTLTHQQLGRRATRAAQTHHYGGLHGHRTTSASGC